MPLLFISFNEIRKLFRFFNFLKEILTFSVYIYTERRIYNGKIKPRITDFKNDLVFKYLLSNMKDEQCRRLLKLIIEDVMDIKCKKINVLNSELNPHHISDKDMIFRYSGNNRRW